MSSNTLPQYPYQNLRKRRASTSLEESSDRMSAFYQSSLIPDDDLLIPWHGTVTSEARVESSHVFTLNPSATSYATNLCLPETQFYDFELPANSYADPVSAYIPGLGWETTPSVVDTYPIPYQALLEDRNAVLVYEYAPDPSARALPQVPVVPSQRSLTSRELAPHVSSLHRGHQNGQSLLSAMPLDLAPQYTTSETLVAPTVFPETPLLRGISFSTASEDNLGNKRSSCSARQDLADTVSTRPLSIPAASTASGSCIMTDPQNAENPLGQPDTTYTRQNESRMPDIIVNIDDPRDPPRYPLNRWIRIISQSHAPVDVRFGRFSKPIYQKNMMS